MTDNPFEPVGGAAAVDPQQQTLSIAPATEVGAVMQESFRLWRALFPVVALTVVLCTVPASLISTSLTYTPLELGMQIRLQQIVDGLLTMVQVGAIGTVLHRSTLDLPTSATAALGGGVALFIPLVILNIPVGLAVGCGLVLLVVPGVYLGTRLCMTHVAYMMEPGSGLGPAISRSWKLTEGRFGPTFLVCLAAVAASLVVLVVYLAATFGWGLVWGITLEVGELAETNPVLMTLDFGVMLILDLLAAYPLLFSWFPIFVYFTAVREESGDLWDV